MPMQGSSHPHAAVVPTQNPPDSAQGLPTAGARGFLPPGQADSSAYVDHAGGHCVVTTNAGCIHTSCGWRGGVKVHEAAGQAPLLCLVKACGRWPRKQESKPQLDAHPQSQRKVGVWFSHFCFENVEGMESCP